MVVYRPIKVCYTLSGQKDEADQIAFPKDEVVHA